MRHPDIADKILELLAVSDTSLVPKVIAAKTGEDIYPVSATIYELMKSEHAHWLIATEVKGPDKISIVAKNGVREEIFAWLYSTGGFSKEYKVLERKEQQVEDDRIEAKRIALAGLESQQKSQLAAEKSAASAKWANVIAWIALGVSVVAVALAIFI